MSDGPLYQASMAAAVKRRLALKMFGGVAVLGWALFSGIESWLSWVGAAIIGLFLVGQLRLLFGAQYPLRVFADRVEVNGLFKISIPREHLHGIMQHPKRNEPAIDFADAEKGHSGPIMIPWRFLDASEHEVLGALKTHLGLDWKTEAA